MQPMWLCIRSSRKFEGPFENTHWRKGKQMWPVWLCVFSGRQFEGPFENAHWRKVEQMQQVWLCICLGKQLEKTFVCTHWRLSVHFSETFEDIHLKMIEYISKNKLSLNGILGIWKLFFEAWYFWEHASFQNPQRSQVLFKRKNIHTGILNLKYIGLNDKNIHNEVAI